MILALISMLEHWIEILLSAIKIIHGLSKIIVSLNYCNELCKPNQTTYENEKGGNGFGSSVLFINSIGTNDSA